VFKHSSLFCIVSVDSFLLNAITTGTAGQMSDLVARLAGLHATLTARLSLRESLLSLSGRLDMVLQQVNLRASTAPAPLSHGGKKGKALAGATGSREPRRYVEGESEQEEAEAMDVELEEGSDMGSVEDIELGAGSGSDVDGDGDMDEPEDEDEDEDEASEEGEDGEDSGDSEEDSEGDEGPWLNGFIDDEAEEAHENEESESE
jgi:U3 small nucleolar RNA-associated protein 5